MISRLIIAAAMLAGVATAALAPRFETQWVDRSDKADRLDVPTERVQPTPLEGCELVGSEILGDDLPTGRCLS